MRIICLIETIAAADMEDHGYWYLDHMGCCLCGLECPMVFGPPLWLVGISHVWWQLQPLKAQLLGTRSTTVSQTTNVLSITRHDIVPIARSSSRCIVRLVGWAARSTAYASASPKDQQHTTLCDESQS